MELFLYIVVIPMAFICILLWMTIFEAWGLPQNWRCKLGGHDRNITKIETHLGWGFFGGPVTTFDWKCRNCGRRGLT